MKDYNSNGDRRASKAERDGKKSNQDNGDDGCSDVLKALVLPEQVTHEKTKRKSHG